MHSLAHRSDFFEQFGGHFDTEIFSASCLGALKPLDPAIGNRDPSNVLVHKLRHFRRFDQDNSQLDRRPEAFGFPNEPLKEPRIINRLCLKETVLQLLSSSPF